MILEVIKSPGLAQLSYLLGDEDAGECLVIDPRRDVGIYMDLARERNCRITAVLDTHIHADFVSGARELEKILGIPIYGGKSDDYGFEINQLDDGASLEVGALTVTCLHTPGHSPEHMCYLVKGGEGSEENWGLFTGDTLFSGSVGRPDLASGNDPEELAGRLYHSLFNKLLPLGEGIIVYPGHGSGSPCGGSIGDRDQTTIGYEAKHNRKLDVADEKAFIAKVMNDLPDEPAYYKRLKGLNAAGAELFGRTPDLKGLDVQQLAAEITEGQDQLIILDVREVTAFGAAHIPGSINIALRSSFPPWAGRILPADKPIFLIGSEWEDVLEAHDHLFRMGFDTIKGFLNGGMRSWIESGKVVSQVGIMPIHELKEKIADKEEITLLDVRTEEEWNQGHLPGARHIFAAELSSKASQLDKTASVIVYCGSDFRADLAASLLKADGFEDVHTVLGSVKAWAEAGFEMEKD
ncbi:MAG: MBL fold metallo-hydrolase [Oceanipulchritudo sp.]